MVGNIGALIIRNPSIRFLSGYWTITHHISLSI